MNERNRGAVEPHVPRIAPDDDDLLAPRRPSRRPGSEPPRPREGGGSAQLMTVWLLLVLLVAAVGAGGWYIHQQHLTLELRSAELLQASERIARLEEQLHVTGENLNKSGSELSNQMGFWETEIRKLWDVTNKRNKGWIEENRAAIAKVDKTVKGEAATMRALKQAIDQHAAQLAELRKTKDLVAKMDARVTEATNRSRDIVDKVNAADTLARGMDRRMKALEEAVASFDAYRLQTNRRLAELGGGATP